MEQAITRCMTAILYMIFSLFEKTGKKLDLPSPLICISRKSIDLSDVFYTAWKYTIVMENQIVFYL